MWHSCLTESPRGSVAAAVELTSESWRLSMECDDVSECSTSGRFVSCDSATGSLAAAGSCAVEGQISRDASHSHEQ